VRILLSCLQDLHHHPIPAYRFWANYFRNGITEAGHEYVEVPHLDWAEGCTSKSRDELRAWRDTTWSRTLEWIRNELRAGRKIDLFLSYFFPQQIDSGAIAEIQKLGVPCVNFFCDNVREFTLIPTEFHCFDLHWVPEFEALPLYQQAKLKTCFAPMPVWVAPEYRAPALSESSGPTFIGSHDKLREDLLGRAIQAGANLTIRGPGWERSPADLGVNKTSSVMINQVRFVRRNGIKQWLNKVLRRSLPPNPVRVPTDRIGSAAWGKDYARLTRESIVTVGINRVPSFQRSWKRPLKYSRLRDIEAPMMGACYLTEWTNGLEHLYEVGREVETYRTAEEMEMKLEQLMSDPNRRSSLRRNGQRKAVTDLSITKSLEQISAILL
jgi:hypothetical protein